MRRVVVVLGTGTGVGKTFVSAGLADACIRAVPEASVLAVKPIETGYVPLGSVPPEGSDAARLERASARVRCPRPHPLYGFPEPVSPHLAARNAGQNIELIRVLRWLATATHANTLHHITIVESAGGAFSPLGPRLTNMDLARALEPAVWLLVAPDSLGVLHDLRVTLDTMAARARLPDLLVLSAARPADASTGTNAEECARVGLPTPVAVLKAGDSAPLQRIAERLLSGS